MEMPSNSAGAYVTPRKKRRWRVDRGRRHRAQNVELNLFDHP